jgi:hypothetical protein
LLHVSRSLHRIALLPTLALLAGCATYTASIRPEEAYDPASAYIYGRFLLRAEPGQNIGGSMGFEINCRDGATYTIGMTTRHSLQMIKIAPSACQIAYIVYGSQRGASGEGKQLATFRLLRNEFLDPGGVYYVGDFLAVSSYSHDFLSFQSRLHWALRAIQDNYEATTDEMKRNPRFAGTKTENRM